MAGLESTVAMTGPPWTDARVAGRTDERIIPIRFAPRGTPDRDSPTPEAPQPCGRSALQKGANDRLRERFAADLNEPQRAAATAPDGFNLILAGPGSGKTRVITYRVAYLIARGVAPESILLVTFTRRAAREMVGRLESLIGPQAARVWAGTFHHVGNRLLRRSAKLLGYGPNFTILDGEDALDLVKLAMDDAGLFGTGKMAPKPAAGPAPHQLRLQRRQAPGARSSPTRTPRPRRLARRDREGRLRPTRRASARPTRWITTTCWPSGPA